MIVSLNIVAKTFAKISKTFAKIAKTFAKIAKTFAGLSATIIATRRRPVLIFHLEANMQKWTAKMKSTQKTG